MDFLSLFALFVLITLLSSVIGIALLLGYLPGRIARERNHPQAEAVSMCGWVGLLTAGLLLPVAFVWAYWSFGTRETTEESR